MSKDYLRVLFALALLWLTYNELVAVPEFNQKTSNTHVVDQSEFSDYKTLFSKDSLKNKSFFKPVKQSKRSRNKKTNPLSDCKILTVMKGAGAIMSCSGQRNVLKLGSRYKGFLLKSLMPDALLFKKNGRIFKVYK